MPAAEPEVLALFQEFNHGNEEATPAREADRPDEEGQRRQERLLTEQHRHRCEVRYCLSQGPEWFRQYAAGVRAQRGRDAAQRLWDDVKAQAKLGNRGDKDDWREEA